MTTRIAIVTGTSSGIGKALTTALLAREWSVVGIARREPQRSEPGYVHVQHDLSDVSAWESLEPALETQLAGREWTRLGLVNNAATEGQMRQVQRLDLEAVNASLALNVAVPIALMGFSRRVCPSGTPLRIVNISSAAATGALPGFADYCAGKAGLRLAGMVVGAEAEAASTSDIKVLSYDPGTVDTAMHERARAESPEDFPSVEIFHEFRRSGMLVPADQVVRPVVDFLEGGGSPGFQEARYERTDG